MAGSGGAGAHPQNATTVYFLPPTLLQGLLETRLIAWQRQGVIDLPQEPRQDVFTLLGVWPFLLPYIADMSIFIYLRLIGI